MSCWLVHCRAESWCYNVVDFFWLMLWGDGREDGYFWGYCTLLVVYYCPQAFSFLCRVWRRPGQGCMPKYCVSCNLCMCVCTHEPHCQDEKDQALSDCILQSREITRLEDEKSILLMKMDYLRECILHTDRVKTRELMTSTADNSPVHSTVDKSPRYLYRTLSAGMHVLTRL